MTVSTPSPDSRPANDLSQATVGQLLGQYRDILAELRARGLVRTNNAPIGDLVEYCAAMVYGGSLAPNSEKSYDLTSADGVKVQVKVRVVRTHTRGSEGFSPIRSFGFDKCIFVVLDGEEGDVAAAREWPPGLVQSAGNYRAHTNGFVVGLRQVTRDSTLGTDRTIEFQRAWLKLRSQRR